jgi:hypothetical protein
MSDMFSFESLTLGHVEAAKAATVLPPGRYVCTTSDAKMKPTKDGSGMRLEVRLTETKGKGMINGYLNVHLPKHPEATRIGQEQLKALLVHGGHPDPDNIGEHGIHSINGLTVGVAVRNKKGTDGTMRSDVSGFMPASSVPGYEDEPGLKDNDLPF